MTNSLMRLRKMVPTALVVITLFLLGTESFAQSDSATLRGTVVDQNGSAILDAKVSITNDERAFVRNVVTNGSGAFSIPLLPPGTYKLRAERESFATVEIPNILLNASDQRQIRIEMPIASIAATVLSEAVTQGVETGGATSTTVDGQLMERLPLNGRSFQSLIYQVPGVVQGQGDGQMSVNGNRTDANYFTVDGVSANVGVAGTPGAVTVGPFGAVGSADQRGAGSIPGFNSFGGTNGLISVDALQEFTIQTSTYSAEFGRQPGGQVQMTSRSGTKEYHGSLYEYFRNESLDANDWFSNRSNLGRAPLRMNNYGGTIGGPIILPRFGEGGSVFYRPDRTFFFLSYEALRLIQPVPASIQVVPAAFLRNYAGLSPDVKALLDAFPMPNLPDVCSPTAPAFPVRSGLVNPCPAGQNPTGAGQFIKNGSNERNLDAFSVRIDHHLNDRWNLFGRVNLAPSEAVAHGLGRKGISETNFTTVTFGLNGVINDDVANELRVNWSRSEGSANTLPSSLDGEMPPDANSLLPSFAPENSFVTYTLPGAASYQLGVQADNLQRQINIVDNVSITKGSHSFKFGFDYRRMNPVYGPQEYTLNFTIGSITNLLDGIANTAAMTSRNRVPILIENYSAYAQDTWRPTRRLTLDLGVRWDVNPAPKGTGDTPLHTLTGLGPITALDTLPPSTLEFADPGTPLYPTRYDAIAPRFGFAYQLRNRAGSETVVRGGYGIYYDLGIGIATNAAFQFPYLRSRQVTNTPYPFTDAAVAEPDPLSLNPPFRNQDFTVIDPDYVLPRSHQWTLTLAQSFGSKYTLTASYVGNAGRRLLRRYSHGFSTSTAQKNDFPGSRLNITTNSSENSDYSDYNALQVQFNRRLSNGFQFLTNYTLAHATDTGSDGTFANFVKNGGDPEADRGDSDFDRRHVFNASMSYDLPRMKYGNGIVRGLLNGWTTDLIFKYQSAAPLSVTYVRNVPGASGFYPYRADFVSGEDPWITDETAPGGRRLNPAAFVVGADIRADPNNVIRQGTATRNSIRGFAATQLDLALGRQIAIGERVKLLFRGEMFNVLNHPNFASPTSSLGTMFGSSFFANGSTFGRSTSMLSRSFGTSTGSLSPQFQFGGPRSVQLSVKLTF